MPRARILLADDYPPILYLLKKLLEQDYDVVGTVADGLALVDAAQRLHPDVIILDVDMPVMNGFQAARELARVAPGCKLFFHSSTDEPDCLSTAFALGASGYILKGETSRLLNSIRTVTSGA